VTRLRPTPAFALAAILGLARPALAAAGNPKEAGGLLFVPILLALVAYPLGLAVHCLILAFAPRRGAGLVQKAEGHRTKTIILGVAHTAFLLLVAAALGQRAPGLSLLVLTLWAMLALVGLFGVARSIGARVLDVPSHGPGAPGGGAEVRALALGWFVVVAACAFPGLGWLLAAYWSVRATGAVVLTLFSVHDAPPPADLATLP
jgi:hypothetical protein